MNVREILRKIKRYCGRHEDCNGCVFEDDFVCSLRCEQPCFWNEFEDDGMMKNISEVIDFCKKHKDYMECPMIENNGCMLMKAPYAWDVHKLLDRL